MIAFVLSLIFFSTSPASRPNVSGSDSANLGFPPASNIAFAVDIKVKDGTITSLPFTSWARSKLCRAEVPELKAKANLEPRYDAVFLSNDSISGPSAQENPLLITFETASMSFLSEYILNNGIFQFIFRLFLHTIL